MIKLSRTSEILALDHIRSPKTADKTSLKVVNNFLVNKSHWLKPFKLYWMFLSTCVKIEVIEAVETNNYVSDSRKSAGTLQLLSLFLRQDGSNNSDTDKRKKPRSRPMVGCNTIICWQRDYFTKRSKKTISLSDERGSGRSGARKIRSERAHDRHDDPRNVLDFVRKARGERVPISGVTRVCPPFHG